MKIVATDKATYMKKGIVYELNEEMAQSLISKGLATVFGEEQKEVKPKKQQKK